MAYDLHKSAKSSLTSFDIRSTSFTLSSRPSVYVVLDTMYSQLLTPTTWGAVLAPQLKAWATLLANETTSNSANHPAPSLQLDLRNHLARQNSNATVDPQVQELISYASLQFEMHNDMLSFCSEVW